MSSTDEVVDVRSQDAGRRSELRTDVAEEDVVVGREVDLDAAAHGLTEADALGFASVIDEPCVGAQAGNAARIELESEMATESEPGAHVVVELTGRIRKEEGGAGRSALGHERILELRRDRCHVAQQHTGRDR